MGWLLSFLTATIAAIAGCLMAFYIGEKASSWYRGNNMEYLGFFCGVLGLLGCFAVGLAVSRFFGHGFFHGTGLSLAAVSGIMAITYLLARLNGDVPPELNGESLELQVELRMPGGWKPSHKVLDGQAYCTLASFGRNARRRAQYGKIDGANAAIHNGQWILPCHVDLHSDRNPLVINVELASKQSLDFHSPLPAHPNSTHEQWSEWKPEKSQQGPDFDYRVRVQRRSVVQAARLAIEVDTAQKRRDDFAALNENSPLKSWLPFAVVANQDDISGKAQRHLATRLADFPALLRDPDPVTVHQALENLRRPEQLPAALNAPILDAGRALLPLIAKSNQADPDDPDGKLDNLIRDYAYTWKEVVKKSGAPADTLYSQIHSAAAASHAGGVRQLAEFIPE